MSGHPLSRFKWLEIEKEVCKSMTTSQAPILPPAIRAIQISLFPRPKRKIPANYDVSWNQLLPRNIGAQMHVMVPVETIDWRAIQPFILLQLRLGHILE